MKSPLKTNRQADAGRTLPAIPEVAYTKEGQQYRPREEIWRLFDGGSEIWVNFRLYQPYCSVRFLHFLKKYMIHILKHQALLSCNNFFRRFLGVVKYVCDHRRGDKVEVITAEGIAGYRSTLARKHEYLLHSLRANIREWVKLGYFGVEREASKTLDEMKLKKNDSGKSVRNHDPAKGPYNDEEFQSIINYLLDNFAEGIIDLYDLVLGFLCLVFGARPVSFAAMRIKDFKVTKNKYGVDQYELRIPAAKRKKGGRRTHFQKRKLTPEYGQMLQALVSKIKADFAEPIKSGFDLMDLPMFPGCDPEKGYATSSQELYFQMMDCFSAGEPIICNREGMEGTFLRVNPKRFRHTIGTRMAEEGKREREIAQALGHVTANAARVYVEATGKIRHSINEKLAKDISPIAQYFLGQIIYSEADAVRGEDPSSRIRCFQGRLKGEVLGNCGKTGFCGGFVPLPCYECRNFQPWVDAPHEEVLVWLLLDRKKKYDATGDERYATVNDEIIKKVADVARRCKLSRENRQREVIAR